MSAGRPLPVWILAAGSFLFVTVELVPAGLLTEVAAGLGTSQADVGRLVTAYGVVVIVASLPLTYLTRNIPRRILFATVLAVYALASAATAFTAGYSWLLVTRMVTAVAQALFWSVVVPTAAAAVPPERTGRAVALVFGGSSLAAVLGVPAATWLGQAAGWRAPFVLLGALGAVPAAAAAIALPRGAAVVGGAGGSTGTRPSRNAYARLVVATAVAVGGSFVLLTYIAPFLVDAARLPHETVGLTLLLRGSASLVGVWVAGRLVDRHTRLAIPLPLVVQLLSMTLLALVPDVSPWLTLALVALTGLAFAALTTALATAVLEVAPGRVELASSGTSIAVNVGIAGGALLGSGLLGVAQDRAIAAAGAVLSAVALAVAPSLGAPRPLTTSPAGDAAPICDLPRPAVETTTM